MTNTTKLDFLVTGCNRSGTTLLASCLSLHSKLIVLNEHHECSVDVLGDKFVGLKAPIPRMDLVRKLTYGQIQVWRKTHWLFKKNIPGIYRLNIQDFISQDKPIFFMRRSFENNIRSIVYRTGVSESIAKKEVEGSEDIFNKIKRYGRLKVLWLDELTYKPAQCLEDCCHFLGVPYESGMNNGSYSKYGHSEIVRKL